MGMTTGGERIFAFFARLTSTPCGKQYGLADSSEKKATMTRLVENYDVDEVRVFEPSLNDIFVEYAGDAAQED